MSYSKLSLFPLCHLFKFVSIFLSSSVPAVSILNNTFFAHLFSSKLLAFGTILFFSFQPRSICRFLDPCFSNRFISYMLHLNFSNFSFNNLFSDAVFSIIHVYHRWLLFILYTLYVSRRLLLGAVNVYCNIIELDLLKSHTPATCVTILCFIALYIDYLESFLMFLFNSIE